MYYMLKPLCEGAKRHLVVMFDNIISFMSTGVLSVEYKEPSYVWDDAIILFFQNINGGRAYRFWSDGKLM